MISFEGIYFPVSGLSTLPELRYEYTLSRHETCRRDMDYTVTCERHFVVPSFKKRNCSLLGYAYNTTLTKMIYNMKVYINIVEIK